MTPRLYRREKRNWGDSAPELSPSPLFQAAEAVGIGNKTVDVELQTKVTEVKEGLHDLKVCAELVKSVSKTLSELTKDSLALSACFQHLGKQTPGATADLDCHHRIQDLTSKNALCLLEALDFFREEVCGLQPGVKPRALT